MYGDAKYLIGVSYFASDDVLFCLASTSTMIKFISLDTADVGNKSVKIIYLIFVRV